jgi:hypothetical protein
MKPVEAKVLEGLRKTTLAYLSDKQYAEVVEAVENQGILGLTGAASRLVKGAVVKHSSHDQKTHGRGGKGGGGGGGGSTTQTGDREAKESEVKNDLAVADEKTRDIISELGNNPQDDRVRDLARGRMQNIRGDLAQASSAKTPSTRKVSLQAARSKISPVVEMLEQQNYNSEAANIDSLVNDINGIIVKVTRNN